MTARVLIVGFGNSLAGDDGLGPKVVARLRERGLPPGVRAEEGGSDSLRLPALWGGEPEVWFVDALVSRRPPGTVRRLDHELLLAVPQRHATVHHLSLPESLRWIALSYPAMAAVRYRMWGVEPAAVGFGEGLTAEVARAVDIVTAEILDQAGTVAG